MNVVAFPVVHLAHVSALLLPLVKTLYLLTETVERGVGYGYLSLRKSNSGFQAGLRKIVNMSIDALAIEQVGVFQKAPKCPFVSVPLGCQLIANVETDVTACGNQYSCALRVSQVVDLAPCDFDLASLGIFERQQTLKNRLDVVFLQLFPIEIVEGAMIGEKPL